MTVTVAQLLIFAAAFAVVIASPGPLVAGVSARAMAFGFGPAAAMAAGAVVGDIVFALVAMFGLGALAGWLDGVVAALKYVGAAWLIWLGIGLLRAPAPSRAVAGDAPRQSLPRAALSGAALGLGNPKAALFYVALFPGFFDVSRLTVWDALAIIAVIAPIMVGGNLIWAAVAARAGRALTSARAVRTVNRLSGGVLGAAGVAIAAS